MKKLQEGVYTVLSGDSQLKTLLGATTLNTKIYPIIPDNFEAFPAIAYSVVGGSFRTAPHGSEDMDLEFHIYADNTSNQGKAQCENIFTRLNYLMNYLQDWSKTITYIKLGSEIDLPEKDRKLWGKVVRYQVWSNN